MQANGQAAHTGISQSQGNYQGGQHAGDYDRWPIWNPPFQYQQPWQTWQPPTLVQRPAAVLCPVCAGVGSMPSDFYNPPPEGSMPAPSASRETCRGCRGRGVIVD